MARVEIDGLDLVVRLSRAERIFALHGDVVVPKNAVQHVELVDEPLRSVHGLRIPGTAIPRRLALGTWRRRNHQWDFVAAYRHRPGVVIELEDTMQRFARLIVSTDGAEAVAAAVGLP